MPPCFIRIHRLVLNANVENFDVLPRLVVLVDFGVLNLVDDIHAGNGSSEDSVAIIEPWRRDSGDEELTAVGIGACIGHRDGIRSIVLEILAELVFELLAPQRLAAGPVAERVSALEHELVNHAMKERAIIVALARETNKVFDRLVNLVGEQAEMDVTERSVEDSAAGNGRACCAL